MGFEVFDALDRDWELLVASREARVAVASWASDPALGVYRGLGELIGAVRSPSVGHAVTDQVLVALARRAAKDDAAARTLLQAIAPGLVNVAKRLRAFDTERHAELLGEAFALVRTYPIERRPRAVAANLCWDTFSRLSRQWHAQLRAMEHEAPLIEYEPPCGSEFGFECVELRDAIARALQAGEVRRGDVELVLRIGAGERVLDLAPAEGLAPYVLQKRVERARRRLADALKPGIATRRVA